MTRRHSNAILIFGTFNPITNAHINLGIQSQKIIDDSDVVFIPAKDEFLRDWKGYDKESILSNRLLLLREVISDNGFEVCEAEINGEVDGKSIHTIEYIKNRYGYENVYFCMGTDKVPELHKWYKAEELVGENSFLVFTRGESLSDAMDEFTSRYADRFTEVVEDEKFYDMSSTNVRNAIKSGNIDSIKDTLPDKVYEYLKGEKYGI